MCSCSHLGSVKEHPCFGHQSSAKINYHCGQHSYKNYLYNDNISEQSSSLLLQTHSAVSHKITETSQNKKSKGSIFLARGVKCIYRPAPTPQNNINPGYVAYMWEFICQNFGLYSMFSVSVHFCSKIFMPLEPHFYETWRVGVLPVPVHTAPFLANLFPTDC